MCNYISNEFANLRAFRAHISYVPMCLRAYVVSSVKLLRDYVPQIVTCLCTYVSSFFKCLHAYIYFLRLRTFLPRIIFWLQALIFHVLTCLEPLRTSELTYIQLMWSLMKINILIHELLKSWSILSFCSCSYLWYS